MTVERTFQGAIVVSDIIGGYYKRVQYFGYTIAQAKREFKRTQNTLHIAHQHTPAKVTTKEGRFFEAFARYSQIAPQKLRRSWEAYCEEADGAPVELADEINEWFDGIKLFAFKEFGVTQTFLSECFEKAFNETFNK